MKIHCIETGKVKIKLNQIRKSEGPAPGMSKILFGKKWSDWLPIYSWVIEHPEGIFIVDTGETHKTNKRGYLPMWHPYYKTSVRFDVRPDQELGPRLRNLGIDPHKDISKVIMTHLHTDHAGGLYHFPGTDILVDKTEFKSASGIRGILQGYLPHRWPEWFSPRFIEYEQISLGPFKRAKYVTRDKRVLIVPTPGHVPTHVSVIVRENGINYFIAGDSSYNQDLMLAGIPAGIGTKASEETLYKIQMLARDIPLIYLPSHDPGSAHRLREKETVNTYPHISSQAS